MTRIEKTYFVLEIYALCFAIYLFFFSDYFYSLSALAMYVALSARRELAKVKKELEKECVKRESEIGALRRKMQNSEGLEETQQVDSCPECSTAEASESGDPDERL